MSYTAEQLSEREFALREAEANDAEERYFEARPVDDGAMHRRSFRAGFERAWFTRGRAHADALEENARLRAERNRLAAEVLRLREQLQAAEKEAHRRDVLLVEAIYGQPCPTQRQWEQMQELVAKAFASRWKP